jgi:hypothetical protein
MQIKQVREIIRGRRVTSVWFTSCYILDSLCISVFRFRSCSNYVESLYLMFPTSFAFTHEKTRGCTWFPNCCHHSLTSWTVNSKDLSQISLANMQANTLTCSPLSLALILEGKLHCIHLHSKPQLSNKVILWGLPHTPFPVVTLHLLVIEVLVEFRLCVCLEPMFPFCFNAFSVKDKTEEVSRCLGVRNLCNVLCKTLLI